MPECAVREESEPLENTEIQSTLFFFLSCEAFIYMLEERGLLEEKILCSSLC